MKTSHLILSLAALTTLSLAFLNIEIAAVVAFTAALVGFALYDYTRSFHPCVAAPTARGAVRRHRRRLGVIA